MEPSKPAGPSEWVTAAAVATAFALSVRIAGFIVASDSGSQTVLAIVAPALLALDATVAGFAVALYLRRRESGTAVATARAARLAAILGALAGFLSAAAFGTLLHAIVGGETVPGPGAWLLAALANGLSGAIAAALLPQFRRPAPRPPPDSRQHPLRVRAYGVKEPRNGATP